MAELSSPAARCVSGPPVGTGGQAPSAGEPPVPARVRSAKKTLEKIRPEQPLRIVLTSTTDVDSLRKKVTGKLSARKAKLPLLEKRQAELAATVGSSKSPTEVSRCDAELQDLVASIALIRGGEEIANFEREIAPLAECFAVLCPDAKVLSFRAAPANQEGILRILKAAASVAEAYYPLDAEFHFFHDERTCRCGTPLAPGDSACPNCQLPVECEAAPSAADPKDTDREAKDNFRREFNRYQGLVHNQIPAKLYEDLDAHFIKNRTPPGEIVRTEFTLTKEGKRFGKLSDGRVIYTSVSMMVEALKKTKNTGYYSDIYYICREYWGWVLPDLKDFEAQIFEDYDRTQVEYNKLVRSGNREFARRFEYFSHRKSNISCRFRLYFHLRARGYPCSVDDFKLPVLPNLRMEYQHLLIVIFEKAGIPVPSNLDPPLENPAAGKRGSP
jgi:hypothetical protein